ncbi:MAG: hypothetical protein K2I19_09480, partial [Muribaculaceae bacterium]|nr:hypothetical protein [Muribaculaceae bacterium]
AHNGSKLYAELSADATPYFRFIKDGLEIDSYGKIQSQSGNTVHVTDADIEVLGAQVNLLNSYTDVGFYYDGDDKLQGYLGWDYVEDIESYYWEYDVPLTRGFCRVDGYLVSVNRRMIWDENSQTKVPGPWTYFAVDKSTPGVFRVVDVVVDDSDVITPEILSHYYTISPVLWFPDGTSFAVEDFFDEESFSKLIDDYNDIINTYLSITGQN